MRKRNRPTPQQLTVPDDIGEALHVRAETHADMARLRRMTPLIDFLSTVMIDRQGRNNYIELLFMHTPKGAP